MAQQMKVEMLAVHGGPFELRRVVDLGETTFVGRMPEIEDRLFVANGVRVVDEIDKTQFWELSTQLASDSLSEIFGPDLQMIARPNKPATAAVAETRGWRSLGCYWADEPSIEIQGDGTDRQRIRFGFTENNRRFSVPVTDIRCYVADHVTPDEPIVDALADRLRGEHKVVTSIGLSRAYHHDPDAAPMHWLQINNIHLPPE